MRKRKINIQAQFASFQPTVVLDRFTCKMRMGKRRSE
jgi:hypothetical protein